MASQKFEIQLVAKIKLALKSDVAMRELTWIINNKIKDQTTLLFCFDSFLVTFVGNGVSVIKEEEKPRGRTILRSLLDRAIQLAGPLNELADFVLYCSLQFDKPARDRLVLPSEEIFSTYPLYQDGWDQMQPNDQNDLTVKAKKKKQEILNSRTFITPLMNQYQKEKGTKPTSLEELFDYDPFPGYPHDDFDRAVRACHVLWDAFSHHNTSPAAPSDTNLKVLDRAFEELRQLLLAEGKRSWTSFYQMWKWTRDRVREKVIINSKGQTIRTQVPAYYGDATYEIYLEACYCAIVLAKSSYWDMPQVRRARGVFQQDRDFLVQPLMELTGKPDRARLLQRLEWAFRNPKEFEEIHRIRRRMYCFGNANRLDHLDEFETVALVNKVTQIQKTNPEQIKKMVVESYSQRAAFKKKFSVFDEVANHFYIYWSEQPQNDKVIIEFLDLPCQLFAATSGRLGDLLEERTWIELAKNARAMLAFMATLFEALGLVIDIVSAGTAGGFRQIAFRFIKNKVMDKVEDVVVPEVAEAIGMDPVALRVFADFAPTPKFGSKLKRPFDASNVEVNLQRQAAIATKDIEGRFVRAEIRQLTPAEKRALGKGRAQIPEAAVINQRQAAISGTGVSGQRRATADPEPGLPPKTDSRNAPWNKPPATDTSLDDISRQKAKNPARLEEKMPEALVVEEELAAGAENQRVIEMSNSRGGRGRGDSAVTGRIDPVRGNGKADARTRSTSDPGNLTADGKGLKDRANGNHLKSVPTDPRVMPPGVRLSPAGYLMVENESLLNPLLQGGYKLERTNVKSPKSGGGRYQVQHVTVTDHEWRVTSPSGVTAEIDGLAVDRLNPNRLVAVEAKATFVMDAGQSAHLRFYEDKVEQLGRQLVICLESKGLMRMEIVVNAASAGETYLNITAQQLARQVRKQFAGQLKDFIAHSTEKAVKRLSLEDVERIVEDNVSIVVSKWGRIKARK